MKRWHSGWLGLALLILLAGSAMAQTTDVPPDHWAYRAVQTLIDRGYMDTDPDGAFNGTDPAARFDVAAAVGRLLEDIESGRIQIGSGIDTGMLRELEQEFREELVQWYAERDRLDAAHSQTQRQVAVIDEQLGRLLIAMEELQTVLRSELMAGLASEAKRTDTRFEDVEGQLDELAVRLEQADDRLAALAEATGERFEDLSRDVDVLAVELDRRVGDVRQLISDLLGEHGSVIDAQFDEQVGALDVLRDRLADLQAVVSEQGEQLEEIGIELHNAMTDQLVALALQLERTEHNVQRLTDDLASLAQVLTMAQKATEDDVAALRDDLDGRTDGLQERLAALQAETASLASDVATLKQELDDLHTVMGTSEEQIARMTERVRMELDDQLALSLSRERQLERQLNELRDEFEGYKAKTEEELQSARNMGGMALGAAALAILLSLVN